MHHTTVFRMILGLVLAWSVGVGGKGWTDLTAAAGRCELVAFCDVDTGPNRRGGFGAAEKWPRARRYTDWRRLFEKEQGRIDAVTVSVAV